MSSYIADNGLCEAWLGHFCRRRACGILKLASIESSVGTHGLFSSCGQKQYVTKWRGNNVSPHWPRVGEKLSGVRWREMCVVNGYMPQQSRCWQSRTRAGRRKRPIIGRAHIARAFRHCSKQCNENEGNVVMRPREGNGGNDDAAASRRWHHEESRASMCRSKACLERQ